MDTTRREAQARSRPRYNHDLGTAPNEEGRVVGSPFRRVAIKSTNGGEPATNDGHLVVQFVGQRSPALVEGTSGQAVRRRRDKPVS